MRALWLVRRNLTQHPGGDTVQILQTAAALRERGVEVTLCDDVRPGLRGYDIAHLFHLDRLWENADHAERLRCTGLPFVLSTIYWPADEFDRRARLGLQGRLARLCGSPLYQNLRLAQRSLLAARERRTLPTLDLRRYSFRRAARRLLAATAVILPNSRAEQEVIAERFAMRRPCVVVPNAADVATFGVPAPGPENRYGVLCVGRLEPRKNQLALIQALRGSDIPLTVVGMAGRYSRAYGDRCREAAGPNVRFIDQRDPLELRELYQAARVHACVSWYETPGLASLEAALCGCALVVTPGGSTREYFHSHAAYCMPGDVASIRQAVERALAEGPPPPLRAAILRKFTWQNAARATHDAYTQALAQDSHEE